MADPNANQFDVARQRAQQQVNASVQSNQDALKRRFTAAGALNSGAAIKESQLAADQGQQQLEQANEGINAQENQQKYAEAQAEKQRQFQTSERLGGQDFATQQAKAAREFQTSERLGGQGFSADQAKLARDLQSSQFGSQMELANKQFSEDQFVNRANIDLQHDVLNQKDILEQLLGGAIGPVGGLVGQAGKLVGGVGHAVGQLGRAFG